jgi:predicted amidohydrolase
MGRHPPRRLIVARRVYNPKVSSRRPLTVAVAQPACVPHDVVTNALTHAAAVRAAGARVVVFPELSLTGYEMEAASITVDDRRLAPIAEACAETTSVALIGAPLRDDGHDYIATLAIDGSGATVAYRKVWVDASEMPRFSPGDRPAVLELDGWRLGLGICRDTGIPQQQADTAAEGIDAYMAGTLMRRHEIDVQNQRARRIANDHRVWVAFASWAGPTGGGYAEPAGGSGVWNPDGVVVAQVGRDTSSIGRATLS